MIGFIDIEYEVAANTVCSKNDKLEQHLAGMIWHLGVHPDYRKQGIAKKLLEKAVELSKEKQLKRLEAWTRDDKFVNNWYKKNGFELMDEYVHWYYDSRYDDKQLLSKITGLTESKSRMLQIFGQATEMTDSIKLLKRKYYCRRFDKLI